MRAGGKQWCDGSMNCLDNLPLIDRIIEQKNEYRRRDGRFTLHEAHWQMCFANFGKVRERSGKGICQRTVWPRWNADPDMRSAVNTVLIALDTHFVQGYRENTHQ
jgi:hypothetical protein